MLCFYGEPTSQYYDSDDIGRDRSGGLIVGLVCGDLMRAMLAKEVLCLMNLFLLRHCYSRLY